MSGRYRAVPYEIGHLNELGEQEAAEGGSALSYLDEGMKAHLARFNSWTLLAPTEAVVACGGTIQQWPGRHIAWLYLTQESARHMTPIIRAVRKVLDLADGRTEATVQTNFAAGHRFAALLGFEVENAPGLLRGYGPNGEDHTAYVRFR